MPAMWETMAKAQEQAVAMQYKGPDTAKCECGCEIFEVIMVSRLALVNVSLGAEPMTSGTRAPLAKCLRCGQIAAVPVLQLGLPSKEVDTYNLILDEADKHNERVKAENNG